MVEVPQTLYSRWRRYQPDQGGSMENAVFYLRSHGFTVSEKEILPRSDGKRSTGEKSALMLLVDAFGFTIKESAE